MSFPLSDIVGPRRPLGIGISVSEFERDYLRQPAENELSRYSTNPRNRMGDWYEDQITARLEEFCPRRGWQWRRRVNLGRSRVHLTDKFVDILVNELLGLELKYLKGGGSLIRPKALVDALDFTNRRVNCLYVIDGPCWLPEVSYLAHWWEFTCANHLEQTISKFMSLQAR